MTDYSRLLPFYKGWDVYQQHLVEAVAPLSAEQLNLEAAPHLRSALQIATHIVSVRAGWTHYVLQEGDEELAAIAEWGRPGQPAKSGAELVAGLETTWRVLQDSLARWSPADLDEVLHDTDENGEDVPVSRQWVIWHLIEHDLHHGGELSFTLGMHNMKAIDI